MEVSLYTERKLVKSDFVRCGANIGQSADLLFLCASQIVINKESLRTRRKNCAYKEEIMFFFIYK